MLVDLASVAISGIAASQKVFQATMSTSILALPISGAPISFEQIEDHSRKLEDSAFIVETRKSKIDRDSSGRLRIESSTPATDIIQLIDPIAGSRVILLSTDTEKIGYRLPWPKSSEVKFAVFSLAGNMEDSSEIGPQHRKTWEREPLKALNLKVCGS